MSATLGTTVPQLDSFVVDPDHSEVGFSVRHLLSRTRGRFARFGGTIHLDRQHPESSRVEFSVEAASIDTRQPDRDAHLRSGDFFDVENHPVIRFESTSVRPLSGNRYQVEGKFSLRGVTKRLLLEVEYFGIAKDARIGERAGFSTEIVLNRKDYGMVWNMALDNGGVILGDEVTVSIDLETIHKVQAQAA
jgi:polyisoprenoid-binding protein YceI